MRHKHVFYTLAKNRLVTRLIRILGAYRLGNISKATALQQSEKAMRHVMQEIERYTLNVQAKRDLGADTKPLSSEALQQLEQDIVAAQQNFEVVLNDAKT